MGEYELPENLPGDDARATDAPEIAPDLEVSLAGGAGTADTVASTLPAADSDEHFGDLDQPIATAYVPIDLDEARMKLDAVYEESGSIADDDLKQSAQATVGDGEEAGQPDDPLETWWQDEDRQLPVSGGSIGKPPGDVPGSEAASDDPLDPDEALERLAARDETASLVGHLGRFTHGPDSVPLKVADDDSTISVTILTAGERAESNGLTPETVIGRKATTDRLLQPDNFYTVFEAETLEEEIIPLVEDLDRRTGGSRTSIVHFTITVEPLGDQKSDAASEFEVNAHPTAGITIWINKDLQTDAYVDANAMDRARGQKVEDFLSRLGFEGVAVPEADQAPYEDRYINNVRSNTLRQLNRFVREQLG